MNNSKKHLGIKIENLFLKQENKITGEKLMKTSMDNILFYTNTISAISSNYTYIIKTASDIQKKDKLFKRKWNSPKLHSGVNKHNDWSKAKLCIKFKNKRY